MAKDSSRLQLDGIWKSIKTLNDDYTRLSEDFHQMASQVAELRADVRWLKALLLPVLLASIISAIKALTG